MPSRVSSGQGNGTGALTSGNLLALFIQWNNQTSTLSSITSDRTTGNLTLKNNPVTDTDNGFRGAFAYGTLTGSGAVTFTPTWGGGAPGTVSYTWIEVASVAGGDPYDNSALAFSASIGTATDAVTSGAAAVQDGSFVWGVCGDLNQGGTLSAGTGFTADITGTVDAPTEYLIQSGAAGRAATFTTSNAFLRALPGMLALKASGSGGAGDLSVSSIGEPVIGGSTF